PRVAAIATTHGGPAQPMRLGNVHRFVPYYLLLASKAVQKITGVHIYRPLAAQRAQTSTELRLAAVRAVAGRDGTGSLRSQSLFRPGELERLLGEGARSEAGQAPLFGRALTIEAALRA